MSPDFVKRFFENILKIEVLNNAIVLQYFQTQQCGREIFMDKMQTVLSLPIE
jgi:hypothetical protein